MTSVRIFAISDSLVFNDQFIFKAGREPGADLPAILRTLSHTNDKDVPEFMEDTNCIHEARLASWSVRLVMARIL